MARGKRNLYETLVKPRLKEIEQWISEGQKEKEVYEALGVSRESFYKYKREHSELAETIKKGRQKPIGELKNALFKRAIGFQYVETKEVEDSDGYKRTERYVKSALPDPTSALILLKHWAKDEGWTGDPQMLALRKKELKLKEQQIEKEEW